MAICVECGAGFSSTRKDAKYCKASCRSNSCQKRKRQIGKAEVRTKDMFILRDMHAIRAKHPDSAGILDKLDLLYGKKALIMALDALTLTGCLE